MAIKEQDTYTDAVMKNYLREHTLDDKFDPTEIRLSSIGGCDRKQMLRVTGAEQDPVDEMALAEYYERGRMVERQLRRMYTKMHPRRLYREVEVETDYGVTGHIDLWWPQKKRMLELKSVSGAIKHYSLPRPKDVDQVLIYLRMFKYADGRRRATDAELVYAPFGRQFTCWPYRVEYDRERAAELEMDLVQLLHFKEAGHVPDVPEKNQPGAFPCFWSTSDGAQMFCEYWSNCWAHPADTMQEEDDLVAVVDSSDEHPPLEKLQQQIVEYSQLREKYTAINRRARSLKGEKKDHEAVLKRLLDHYEVDALHLPTGDKTFRITRTHVSASDVSYTRDAYQTWNLKELEDETE